MAISYPLTPPSTPGLLEIVWSPESAVAVQRSPFSFASKTYAWDGQIRRGTAKYPPMEFVNAKVWQAFILSLNGEEGTFYLKDTTFARVPRGSVADSLGGVAIAAGGGAVGTDLTIDGLPTSETGVLKAGDYLSVSDRLYTVLADADSDGSGVSTVSVWPFIRSAIADDTAVLIGSAARGIFRMTAFPEYRWDPVRLMSGFSFGFEEE